MDFRLKIVNEKTLEKITAELASKLIGGRFGKIFTISRYQMAIDYRLPDSNYLYISVEPSAPRVYTIKRRLRDLEKQTVNQTSFVMFLRKRLAGGVLQSIEKLEGERILRLEFSVLNDFGETDRYFFIVQLTGRSANLLLLDKNDFVLDACRETHGAGQEIASKHSAPERSENYTPKPNESESYSQGDSESLSEALDIFYLNQEAEKNLQAKAGANS